MSWQEIAKSLPIGQKRKIPCCGTDATSYVSQDHRGIRMGPCFRCGDKRYVPHGPRSVAEVLAARAAIDAVAELREIPKRCIMLSDTETPSEAILWVLQAGLAPEMAETVYGMRYDPVTRRVCIPITGGFLSRAVFNERPKYIKAGASKTEMHTLRGEGPAVLVEDILSAIAINRAGFTAISALGTAITATIAADLGKYPVLISWTDADKAGDKAWAKLRKRMGLYPTVLHRIRTEKDPKEIHRGEIVRLIGECYA